MQQRAAAIIDAELERNPPPTLPDELAEDRAFLRWLADDHFTFLGYRDYDLVAGRRRGRACASSPARAWASCARAATRRSRVAAFAALPPEVRAQARGRELLVSPRRTRAPPCTGPGYLDYIGVKRFDADGKVCGERPLPRPLHLVGLQRQPGRDSAAAAQGRRRWSQRAGFRRAATPRKALVTILDSYPRDELFQIGDDELLTTAMGILRLGERQRSRLFVRRDPFERFVSCLIYVPRENYTTELRAEDGRRS